MAHRLISVRRWLWKIRWQRRGFRRKKKPLIRRGAFILALAALAILTAFLLFDNAAVGDEIDSYKGVVVYYNGSLQEAEHESEPEKHYSPDGYYFGQKWQCVEFVKRFYCLAKNHRMPDTMGHARDFFDPALKQGRLSTSRGLVQYWNGGNVKPAPDDLLVFTDGRYGHVAIVSAVTDNYIEMVQQNMGKKSRQRLPLFAVNGRFTIGDRWVPAGWLRKETR